MTKNLMTKIYVLRHEKRDIKNPLFHSPLLKEGKEDAEKLKYLIEKLNIEIIFSSPFIRVLQTIEPYCLYKKKKVNIDLSLYEHISTDFDEKDFKFGLNNITYYSHIINYDYKSFGSLDNVEYDSYDCVKKNVNEFKKYLLDNYKNKNILLVTHLGVINAFLNNNDKYKMGSLINVSNNEILN